MAGDWIKVEKATPAKPEVLAISEILGVHPVHSFGLCVKFWMWCDDHLTDGNAKSVTKVTLDFVVGQEGMTNALVKVGWLRDRSGSLEVPHFDRHLSEGAKNRSLTKERVMKSKAKNKAISNANTVTEVTQTPLLEKRREEINNISSHSARERPSSIEEAIAYAATQPGYTADVVRHWFAQRDSQLWMKANNHRVSNWKSDLDAWVLNQRNHAPATNGSATKTKKQKDLSW